MRPRFRVLFPLIGSLVALSVGFAFYQASAERSRLQREFDRQGAMLAGGLVETVEPALARGAAADLQEVAQRFASSDHIQGIAVFDAAGILLAITPGVASLPWASNVSQLAPGHRQGISTLVRAGAALWHVFALPMYRDEGLLGVLAVVHDASEIDAQATRVVRDLLIQGAAQALLLIACLMVLRSSVAGQIQNAAAWIRSVHTGKKETSSPPALGGVFKTLAVEIADLAGSFAAARASAEQEARLRDASESRWTAERLRVNVQGKLQHSPLFVVANREPYMHVTNGNGVAAVLVPASGLVTAIEPVLVACAGTWVAHGSGNADRTVTDEHDRVRVPPHQPRYTLRRVWLTDEEEKGYYQGFANEGLWPLCHIAHTRPIFRSTDWQQYQAVNRKFGEVVLEEMADSEEPVVLVQDYHFALLPRLVKEQRPDARVAIFWHIPWPNSEAFGICPWQRELLDGLLGADLIGFHTQFHCNNFLETVERVIESRVEWERFSVRRNGRSTSVRPFPISVACGGVARADESAPADTVRAELLARLGIQATLLGVGVDRVDYTKGIIERFRGLERCFERFPEYLGRFTFAQIAAPSRTDIGRYADLLREVDAEAERVNRRFQTRVWKPIILLKRHHSHEEIEQYYRAADLCLITALHDGMNLVAKEFVASRSDEGGVLILSAFAGASHELADAIIVNPYDIDQMADAIRRALEMRPEERTSRMRRMRQVVADHNVYRWAGSLIAELCDIRLEKAQQQGPPSRM